MSRYNVKVKFYDSGEIQIHSFPNGVDFDESTLLSDHLDIFPDSGKSKSSFDDSSVASSSKNTNSDHISNINRSLRRTKQTLFNYALNNTWDYFVTFTFDSFNFDRNDLSECRRYMCKWLNNTKNQKCPDMKYLGVQEFHKKEGIHFHFLISGSKLDDFLILSDNQKKYPNMKYAPSYPSRNLWDPVRDSASIACYMVKYITKDLVCAELACQADGLPSTLEGENNISCDQSNSSGSTRSGTKARYIRSRNLKGPEERTFFLLREDLPDGIDLASYIYEKYFPEYSIMSVSQGRSDSTFMRLQ